MCIRDRPGILRQSCGVSYSQFTLPEGTTVSSCCAEIDCRNDNQAELWMELLTPDDGTRTLLRYQHPAWGECAAATEADYGRGRAMYVGFLPQKGLISQLFDVLTADIALRSRTSAYRDVYKRQVVESAWVSLRSVRLKPPCIR